MSKYYVTTSNYIEIISSLESKIAKLLTISFFYLKNICAVNLNF